MSSIKIDKLIRSHRKTIGLQITKEAHLIVRAPYLASEAFIYKLINRKVSWIKSKQEYFKQHQNKTLSRTFTPGEEFLFLGQSYTLQVVDDLPKAVVLGDFLSFPRKRESIMIAQVALNNARDHLECWYKTQALEYITQRVEYYASSAELKYKSVRVNDAATRWGSCGHKDTLNFTWRLIMAPSRVIDYVVVHELMHIKEKNHSKRFWSEVKSVIDDYRWDEIWLKKNAHLLSWPNSGIY